MPSVIISEIAKAIGIAGSLFIVYQTFSIIFG